MLLGREIGRLDWHVTASGLTFSNKLCGKCGRSSRLAFSSSSGTWRSTWKGRAFSSGMRFRPAEEERGIGRIKGRVPRKVTRPPSQPSSLSLPTTVYSLYYIIFLSYLPLLFLSPLFPPTLSLAAKHTNGRTYTCAQAEHCRGLIGSYRAVMSHNGADNARYNTPPASKPFNPRQPPPDSSSFCIHLLLLPLLSSGTPFLSLPSPPLPLSLSVWNQRNQIQSRRLDKRNR